MKVCDSIELIIFTLYFCLKDLMNNVRSHLAAASINGLS